MNNNRQSNNQNNSNVKSVNRQQRYSGLYIFGTVIDRTRRMVPKDNPTTEIVTYTVETDTGTKHYVDDYAPNSYYDLGQDVNFPVYIKTYKRKNGDASYTLMIQHVNNTRGEHF